ncbi:hypothetical protein NIES22_59370 [Calothrix brevissima NIES-22]|nr:hypothetical protein NIES22_59370 [Calothrix brevissima NIES-22]
MFSQAGKQVFAEKLIFDYTKTGLLQSNARTSNNRLTTHHITNMQI